MTRIKYYRLFALSICCAIIMSLLHFNVLANEVALNPALSDQVEVSLNGGPRQLMTLYSNATYETTLEGVEGNASYTVYLNGEAFATNSINPTVATDIHVRFTPFKPAVVTDSLNHPNFFPIPAAWVGNFTLGLNDYLEDPIAYWDPADSNGFLDYIGGGTYGRTFTFTEPLREDIDVSYKIALGGSWGSQFGDIGNNGDIHITIPAGSQSITLWADTLSMVCIDSISADPFIVWDQGVPIFTAPAGTLHLSLRGNFTAWELLDRPLTQVAPNVYAFTQYIEAGNHLYQYVFDTQLETAITNFTLSTPATVIFLFDVTDGTIYDSINNPAEVIELMNFQREMTWEELEQMVYDGDDLGATYTKDETTFKVWAPSASQVELNLYATGSDSEPKAADLGTFPMGKSENNDGVWSITKDGDYHGTYYTYSVTVGSRTNETVDIYAEATGVNGNRGMVIDLASTNPPGWENDQHVTVEQVTDAVVWELHVRDFSTSPDSGISEENRGNYLAFTENGTTVNGEGQYPTGMDYIKDLGINYVHLLPVFDHDNDETTDIFNWGYNPKNYNVPEGQYSSNPMDGATRITEFKQMVMAFHDAGIGVVMDVVYNHTGPTHDSWFNLTVPNYYYRMTDNGAFFNCSGCGNVTASERFMMRKYMIESILYWVQEYHIDGFRFDLMGLHDVETMNMIRQALNDEGYEDVIIYGEPWDMAEATLPEGGYYATQENADKLMDGIVLFNDYYRDAAKGFVFDSTGTGFLQGGQGKPSGYTNNDLLGGILASSKASAPHFTEDIPHLWSQNPGQTATYISCHDNATLWDRLLESVYGVPTDDNRDVYREYDDNLVAMNKMAATLTFTSQGLSLIHAGEEIARTKFGDHNSYESPDEINQIIWEETVKFADLHAYYKGMIEINKAYAPFRDMTNKTIEEGIKLSQTNEPYVIAYTLQDVYDTDGWDSVAILFNSSSEEKTVMLEMADGSSPDEWVVIANGEQAGLEELDRMMGMEINIPAQTSLVLVDSTSYEREPDDIDTEIPVTEINLTAPKNILEVGESIQLSASFVPQNATIGNTIHMYSSSNNSIATVNNQGQVTAHAPGVVTIYAQNEQGIKGSYVITVISPGTGGINDDTKGDGSVSSNPTMKPPISTPQTSDISLLDNMIALFVITAILGSLLAYKERKAKKD